MTARITAGFDLGASDHTVLVVYGLAGAGASELRISRVIRVHNPPGSRCVDPREINSLTS